MKRFPDYYALDAATEKRLKRCNKLECELAIKILKARIEFLDQNPEYRIFVFDLPVSRTIRYALVTANLRNIGEVLEFGLDRLHTLKNCGLKSEKKIKDLFELILPIKHRLAGKVGDDVITTINMYTGSRFKTRIPQSRRPG